MAVRGDVLLAALAVLLCAAPVGAQKHRFDATTVESAYSLQTHYIYFVGQTKPTDPVPTVKFTDMIVASSDEKDLTQYVGVEVHLVRSDKFWDIIDPEHFCTSAGALGLKASGDRIIYSHAVSATASSKEIELPRKAGEWVLTITNCGNEKNLIVGGSVDVKSSWGYLPANEQPKMNLYIGLTVIYGIIALIWTASAVSWWASLFTMQKALTAVVWLCFAEGVAGIGFMNQWNQQGDLPAVAFMSVNLFFTWKCTAMFEMLLFAPQKGAKEDITLGGHAVLLFYMLALFNFKIMMSYRFSNQLPLSQILLNCAPLLVMFVVIFVWTFKTLSTSITFLEEQKDEKKMGLYKNLRGASILGAMLTGLCGVLQVLDSTMSSPPLWKFNFMMTEGNFQIAFMIMLAIAMGFTWPSQENQEYLYGKAGESGQEGNVLGAPESIWDDDDCEDGAAENKTGSVE